MDVQKYLQVRISQRSLTVAALLAAHGPAYQQSRDSEGATTIGAHGDATPLGLGSCLTFTQGRLGPSRTGQDSPTVAGLSEANPLGSQTLHPGRPGNRSGDLG